MKYIVVPALTEELDRVQEFIDKELGALNCPMRAQFQIDVAVEEIFVNIASYAYRPDVGEAEIRVEIHENPLSVSVQFLDNGKPFDPLAREDADTSQEAIERREGGLGILMVKKSMDDVNYVYENGKNILTIKKTITPED